MSESTFTDFPNQKKSPLKSQAIIEKVWEMVYHDTSPRQVAVCNSYNNIHTPLYLSAAGNDNYFCSNPWGRREWKLFHTRKIAWRTKKPFVYGDTKNMSIHKNRLVANFWMRDQANDFKLYWGTIKIEIWFENHTKGCGDIDFELSIHELQVRLKSVWEHYNAIKVSVEISKSIRSY